MGIRIVTGNPADSFLWGRKQMLCVSHGNAKNHVNSRGNKDTLYCIAASAAAPAAVSIQQQRLPNPTTTYIRAPASRILSDRAVRAATAWAWEKYSVGWVGISDVWGWKWNVITHAAIQWEMIRFDQTVTDGFTCIYRPQFCLHTTLTCYRIKQYN